MVHLYLWSPTHLQFILRYVFNIFKPHTNVQNTLIQTIHPPLVFSIRSQKKRLRMRWAAPSLHQFTVNCALESLNNPSAGFLTHFVISNTLWCNAVYRLENFPVCHDLLGSYCPCFSLIFVFYGCCQNFPHADQGLISPCQIIICETIKLDWQLASRVSF